MTEKELSRMGRKELIEIIAEQKKRELELQEQVIELEEELAERRILLENAGSIAEASLSIHEVFETAQEAADTYLLSIRAANEEMNKRMALAKKKRLRILQQANQEAAEIIREAKRKSAQILAETERRR